MTCRALSARSIARHAIDTHSVCSLHARFSSKLTSYDLASNIGQVNARHAIDTLSECPPNGRFSIL